MLKRIRGIRLAKEVYIKESGSVVGEKEGDGQWGNLFDVVHEDAYIGKDNWEDAESELQRIALMVALTKSNTAPEDIDCMFAGDLLSQSTASSYGLVDFSIPHYGIYGACSNCGEGLALAAMLLASNMLSCIAVVTSSHFGSAEKEFRFPLAYGSQRPPCTTWTVTGSAAFILEAQKREKSMAKIVAITMGEMVDPGIKDFQNMGVCMAPATALTIEASINDLPYKVEEYDQIITGDLGEIGSVALYDLLMLKGIDIKEKHMDCGLMIYDREKQDVNAGGSGCGCSATMLSAYILPKLSTGEWARVLFVPTGALLSKVRSQEGMSIPGIAHAVVIEKL